MADLKIEEVEVTEGWAHLAIRGEIDLDTVKTLKNKLNELMESGVVRVSKKLFQVGEVTHGTRYFPQLVPIFQRLELRVCDGFLSADLRACDAIHSYVNPGPPACRKNRHCHADSLPASHSVTALGR